ncbi:hypothetical protein MUK42_10884 [Musa troglodytarum]|uniref:Late embryogenesis abundant protein LEA-2 subgroup domain-containing protein n=1 Tax=Musa troglodytarum TaxID=320322 RepID=A0A9E7GXK8_9LILI|nr:hypothetical protein MUK42_10884 [Musa troglodytarum]
MSKGCSHHHGHCDRKKLYLRIFFVALFFIVLVLLAVFIIWLVLRPSKPGFYLQDASIAQFNFTAGTNLLTAIMQVTVSSHNPNDRIGIYYDKLDAFAVYQEQRITASTELPTGYQGHNDVVVWTTTPASSWSTSTWRGGSGGRSARGPPATTTSMSPAPPSWGSITAAAATAMHRRSTSSTPLGVASKSEARPVINPPTPLITSLGNIRSGGE